jgi:hypothetical protein
MTAHVCLDAVLVKQADLSKIFFQMNEKRLADNLHSSWFFFYGYILDLFFYLDKILSNNEFIAS